MMPLSLYPESATPGYKPFSRRMLLASFLIAAAFVAVCSKSSFLYPINDWGDANTYMTVARMMLKGRVLYADIFEQKGLYLYALHILASLISYPSFFGVYLLETLALTFFLFFTYRAMALYLPLRLILPMLPLLAFSIANSLAFTHGDSAEELMLPLLAYSLYKMLQWADDRNGGVKKPGWFIQGLVTAFIFWTKYTILSFHIGFCVAILIVTLLEKDYRALLRIGALWLMGLIAGSIPALIYFGVNGALRDMVNVYFLSNTITYGGEAVRVVGEQLSHRWGGGALLYFGRIFMGLAGSPLMTGLALAGFWGLGLAQNNESKRSRVAVRCVFVSIFLVLLSLPIVFNYYFLPVGVLSILGLIYYMKLLQKLPPGIMTLKRALLATFLVMAVLIPRSLAASQNAYLLLYSQKDLPQYHFRDIMREVPDATLLTHVNMDHGFQNVAEIVPDYKYFVATNTSNPEREEAWRDMIMNGKVDFLLSNNQELEPLYPGMPYELAAIEWHPYEAEVYTYRLYKLKEAEGL